MRNIITKHAREMLALIIKEHELQLQRYQGGFIGADQVERGLIERLNAIGKNNPGMRAFLTYVGPIPKSEDEDPDKPWADDPREGRRHVVHSKRDKAEGKLGVPRKWEDDPEWPEPGERIC